MRYDLENRKNHLQVKYEYILENVQRVDITSFEEGRLGSYFNMQHKHANK